MDLASPADLPSFTFVGKKPPVLLEAFFDAGGTRLILRFNTEATNRAGMNGVAPCRMVLTNVTASVLRGAGGSVSMCFWQDDSTLIALLSSTTSASRYMEVSVRGDVLWPQGYLGSCEGNASLCMRATTLPIDQFFPCDSRFTDARELCVVPQSFVQAPLILSSCSGTAVTLDASRSEGGGVRPLSYIWSANPRTCDNYLPISAVLKAAGSVSSIKLPGSALDGGQGFEIRLRVVNFLGARSTWTTVKLTRAPMPVPLVAIQAPPLLTFPRIATVSIEAEASIASCFAAADGSASILFSWSHVGSSGNTSAAPPVLDERSSQQRDLVQPPPPHASRLLHARPLPLPSYVLLQPSPAPYSPCTPSLLPLVRCYQAPVWRPASATSCEL